MCLYISMNILEYINICVYTYLYIIQVSNIQTHVHAHTHTNTNTQAKYPDLDLLPRKDLVQVCMCVSVFLFVCVCACVPFCLTTSSRLNCAWFTSIVRCPCACLCVCMYTHMICVCVYLNICARVSKLMLSLFSCSYVCVSTSLWVYWFLKLEHIKVDTLASW